MRYVDHNFSYFGTHHESIDLAIDCRNNLDHDWL